MELLDYTSVPTLGISRDACERYTVPQVKTQSGVKLAAVFSERCYKVLSLDGSYYWHGDYDPSFGLFGQRACIPGNPVVIVSTELEALKLASLGYSAVCLPEPKVAETLCFSILEETLITVSRTLAVWTETAFGERQKALEKFLLHLLGSQKIEVLAIDGSNVPILTTSADDINAVLKSPEYKSWKPSGIIDSEELLSDPKLAQPVVGISSGFECINTALGGVRRGEVTTIAAGSGVGKTTLLQQIAYHLGMNEDAQVGIIFLEEQPIRTLLRLAAIKYKVSVSELRKNPHLLTPKQWDELRSNKKLKKNFVFHNHFGSLDSEDLFRVIDYMIDHRGCQYICIDHISIAVSGISSKEGERKDIDILMTKIATRAVSKNVGFWLISHLSIPDGAPHEEGGRVTLSSLRGSGSIKQLSFNILAGERNQQDPDSCLVLIRSLKCRETGVTGPMGVLKYDRDTGLLEEDFSWDVYEFEESLRSFKRGKSSGQRSQYGNTKFIQPY